MMVKDLLLVFTCIGLVIAIDWTIVAIGKMFE